jgi:hypothetical protein
MGELPGADSGRMDEPVVLRFIHQPEEHGDVHGGGLGQCVQAKSSPDDTRRLEHLLT